MIYFENAIIRGFLQLESVVISLVLSVGNNEYFLVCIREIMFHIIPIICDQLKTILY